MLSNYFINMKAMTRTSLIVNNYNIFIYCPSKETDRTEFAFYEAVRGEDNVEIQRKEFKWNLKKRGNLLKHRWFYSLLCYKAYANRVIEKLNYPK